MAYIYRYQLKNVVLRNNIILTQYKKEINSVLYKHFNKNLKDSIVEEKYFEFKLYSTVHMGLLQEMGRKLKDRLSIIDKRYGFIRMEQTFYALVYSIQDDLENNDFEVKVEFIDSMLIEKHDLFMNMAYDFFEKNGKSRDLLNEKGYFNNIEDVIKNYYIDILDAYIDKQSIPKFLKNTRELACFYVKGIHKHFSDLQQLDIDDNMLLLENSFDVGYIENRETINGYMLNTPNRFDYIKIYASKEHLELIEKINGELKLYISETDNIDALDNIKVNSDSKLSRRYIFKVHEVGQALATSLSFENNPPFLYFDYGMPFGRNSFTRPVSVNMPTNPGSTIIISHVDKDHWFRIADDFSAYQCHWFIPNQLIKKQLMHKFAEIIVHGGSVHILNKDIVFCGGKLTCSGVSKIDKYRLARHVHETGLSLRFDAHNDEGNDLNILIAGDQRYDFLDVAQLSDLDILVASHHGGLYCWSTSCTIPKAKYPESSVVIYSYGRDNTHNHPSKVEDYDSKDWQKTHHICNDGEFKISVFF